MLESVYWSSLSRSWSKCVSASAWYHSDASSGFPLIMRLMLPPTSSTQPKPTLGAVLPSTFALEVEYRSTIGIAILPYRTV